MAIQEIKRKQLKDSIIDSSKLDSASVTTAKIDGDAVTISKIESQKLKDIDGLSHEQGGMVISDGSNFIMQTEDTLRASIGLTIGSEVQAHDTDLDAIAALTPADNSIIIGNASNAWSAEAPSAARTSLGLEIGADVQAYDAELAAIAGLASSADKLPYFDGSESAALTDFSSYSRTLLDDADAAAARVTLGLEIGVDVQAFDSQLADVSGLSPTDGNIIIGDGSNFVLEAGNVARTSLGLGTGDSPTFSASTISNALEAGELDVTGGVSIGSTLDMNSSVILGLATPSADSHAANKAYVDSIAQGLDIKESVRAATSANITLSGTQSIDGVSILAGERVLVKEQTDASENGVYIADSGSWTRSEDMSAGYNASGSFLFVEEGSSFADNGFVCASDDSADTVGTDDLSFQQFSGAGQITAGEALLKTGDLLDVQVDDSSIQVDSDSLKVKALGVTNAMLAGSIENSKLTYSSISGISLGSSLGTLSPSSNSGLAISGTYDGSSSVSMGLDLETLSAGTFSLSSSSIAFVDGSGDTVKSSFGLVVRELLGSGLGYNASDEVEINIESGYAADSLSTSATVESISVKEFDASDFGITAFGSAQQFSQVYLNGILQKGLVSSTLASSDYSSLNSGNHDYIMDMSLDKLHFLNTDIDSGDTVFVYCAYESYGGGGGGGGSSYSFPSSAFFILNGSDSNSYSGSGSTWNDVSGEDNDATFQNSPSYDSSTNLFSFTGSEYVELPSGFADFSNGFTAFFVANFGTAQSWERIFDFSVGGNTDHAFNIGRHNNTDKLSMQWYKVAEDNSNRSIQPEVIVNNQLASYAITADGTNAKVYRNGTLLNTISFPYTLSDTTRTQNWIGASRAGSSENLRGTLGFAAIWQKVLTGAEIEEIHDEYANDFGLSSSEGLSSSGDSALSEVAWNSATGITEWDMDTDGTDDSIKPTTANDSWYSTTSSSTYTLSAGYNLEIIMAPRYTGGNGNGNWTHAHLTVFNGSTNYGGVYFKTTAQRVHLTSMNAASGASTVNYIAPFGPGVSSGNGAHWNWGGGTTGTTDNTDADNNFKIIWQDQGDGTHAMRLFQKGSDDAYWEIDSSGIGTIPNGTTVTIQAGFHGSAQLNFVKAGIVSV